jgi:hypothetical protein
VNGRIEVRIADMPEVLAGLRHEMARMLRARAEGEPATVRAALEEVAAAFEAGQPQGGLDVGEAPNHG